MKNSSVLLIKKVWLKIISGGNLYFIWYDLGILYFNLLSLIMELIYKYSFYRVNETTSDFNIIGDVKFSNNIESFDGCINSTTLIDWADFKCEKIGEEIIVTFKQGIYNDIEEAAKIALKELFLDLQSSIS